MTTSSRRFALLHTALAVAVVTSFPVVASASAADPEIVDVPTELVVADNAVPTNLVSTGDRLFFSAYDAEVGRELWGSDGTPEGTGLVKDIYPGTASGHPEDLTSAGGTLFFSAHSPDHGFELWASDGSTQGTRLVKDIAPGADGSYPRHLVALGDVVLFAAITPDHGAELWRSDGTEAGTWMVQDIKAGAQPSDPDELVTLDGVAYFRAATEEQGTELWRSDGTAAGTYLVRDIDSGPSSGWPADLVVAGQRVYFSADGPDGRELWSTDGSADDTAQAKDLNPGSLDYAPYTPEGSDPYPLGALGDRLLLLADDGEHGREYWISDGTSVGTTMLGDLNPGPSDSSWNEDRSFAAVTGLGLFVADDGTHGRELWRTDGTAAGTVMVRDVMENAGDSHPWHLAAWQGEVYFQSSDGYDGTELWRSDGTAAGTVLVADLYPGSDPYTGFPNESRPDHFTAAGEALFLAATSASGRQLWQLTKQPATPADTTAPETAIVTGPPTPTNEATVLHEFSADEPATFECRLDDSAWAACTSPETTGPLTDGPHEFEVRATDTAGNTDPSPAVSTFTVDTEAPETAITAGPSGTSDEGTVLHEFSADEPATFECRLDDSAWAACTSPETTGPLTDGPHEFEVRATDTAGNTDPSPAVSTFTVDTSTTESGGEPGGEPEGEPGDPGRSPACLAAVDQLDSAKSKLEKAKTKLTRATKQLKAAKKKPGAKVKKAQKKVKKLKARAKKLKRKSAAASRSVQSLCS